MSSKGPYYKTTANFTNSLPTSHLMHQPGHYMREEIRQSKPLNHPLPDPQPYPREEPQPSDVKLDMKWETLQYANSADPQVWGPAFWFILHNGSARYPEKASPLWKESMRGFILGMPAMIPCEVCADHARAHIEANWNRLDEIVNGRKNLFNFFVDMHNMVNKRYGKPIMSHEDAYELYTGRTNVTKLTYKNACKE